MKKTYLMALITVSAALSGSAIAKSPADQVLDVLTGPELGSRRSFECKEIINGKVTDEAAFYEFGRGNDYRRRNTYKDPRMSHVMPMIRGQFDVRVQDGVLKIAFHELWLSGDGFNDYSATIFGSDGKDNIGVMMDRPLPYKLSTESDHLRLVCTGRKPSDGTGKQRAY